MGERSFQYADCGHKQPFEWDKIEWLHAAHLTDRIWDYSQVRATTDSPVPTAITYSMLQMLDLGRRTT